MRQNIDRILLRKIFESKNMLDTEIADLFGFSEMKIRYERAKMGLGGSPQKITCNVCKEPKTPNCYKAEYPGICIKCRQEMGIESRTWSGGRPMNKPKKKRPYRCLRCPTVFMTPLDDQGVPIIHFCDKCQKQIPYWGDNPEEQSLRI